MRVLLKISGEALKGVSSTGIEGEAIGTTAQNIAALYKSGVEMGVVCGGGNFFRGAPGGELLGLERSTADRIGMLATVMNALALQKVLHHHGCPAFLLTSFDCPSVSELFRLDLALKYLKTGVVLFAGGTGHPYFTTDTAAALRASEIKADLLLKGTMHVDGVYDADPRKHKGAKFFPYISYKEYLEKKLAILDLTAITLCMTNHIPVRVFNFMAAPLTQVCEKNLGSLIGDERWE